MPLEDGTMQPAHEAEEIFDFFCVRHEFNNAWLHHILSEVQGHNYVDLFIRRLRGEGYPLSFARAGEKRFWDLV